MSYCKKYRVKPGGKVRLDWFDPNSTEGRIREAAERQTQKALKRMRNLQYLLYANADRSLLIVLQGPDASGKDGLIRHLFSGLNPQGVDVSDFKEPTATEAAHDFLWRIHRRAPAKGKIMIFNRSHYEEVLLGRVHGHDSRDNLKQKCILINAFEETLAQSGTTILKFYLHISSDEQLQRFARRLEKKSRQWKISEADYSDRDLWDQFAAAYEDALQLTSTLSAPWYVVPSNHKWFRNFVISRIVTSALRKMNLSLPQPRVDMDQIRHRYHEEKQEA